MPLAQVSFAGRQAAQLREPAARHDALMLHTVLHIVSHTVLHTMCVERQDWMVVCARFSLRRP